MNHCLKKICAIMLATVMGAASVSQPLSAAGNEIRKTGMESKMDGFGTTDSIFMENEPYGTSGEGNDSLSAGYELEQFSDAAAISSGELQLDKQVKGTKVKTDNDLSGLMYTFTPDSMGYYQIECHADIDTSKDIWFDIGIDSRTVTLYNVNGNTKGNNLIYQVLLPKKREIEISIYLSGNDLPNSVSYTIKVIRVKAEQISENKEITSSFNTAFVPYCFKPEKTGVYQLSVFNDMNEVKLDQVYDDEKNMVQGTTGGEKCYFKCNKGQQYYFYIVYRPNDFYGIDLPDYDVEYTLQIERIKSNQTFDYIVEDNQIAIMGYSGNETEITIPKTMEDIPVTSIGAHVFENCEELSKVVIPGNIKKIGKNSFAGCSSLKSVTISEGVAVIEEGAFMRCTSLQSVTVPKSVKEMQGMVFNGCDHLTSAVINAEIKLLNQATFSNCAKLKNIKLPNSLVEMNEGNFARCRELEEVVIPDSVTALGGSTFEYCTKLKNIELPKKLKHIYRRDFYHCDNLENISIPSSVETIGEAAFEFCGKLKNVALPSALLELSDLAFASCMALKSIALPKNMSVTVRQSYTDPQSPDISSVGNPFANCSKLEKISVHKNNRTLSQKDGILYMKNPYKKDSNILVVCPSGKKGKVLIDNNAEFIASAAFEGCSQVTEITIPKKTALPTEGSAVSFNAISKLKKITIDPKNKTAKSVKGALYSKDGTTLYCYPKTVSGKAVVSEGVTDLGNGFRNCSKLTEISLPSSVTDITSWVFSGCDSLLSIKVDSKNKVYKSVNESVYSKDGKELCAVPTGIKGEYKIPKGVKTIDIGGAFAGCDKITKIYIPASVTSIDRTYASGHNLEAYVVDENNKYFCSKSGVLYDKKVNELIHCPNNMGNFKIPSTVTKIRYIAFGGGRPRITKLTLPKNIKLLGLKAFVSCNFDVYFECDVVPGEDGYVFPWATGTLYYDASNKAWETAVSNDPYLYGTYNWKKMNVNTAASIKLNTSSKNLSIGETCTLKATVTNAAGKAVSWSTSDKTVATVSSKGVVTAKSIGKATISAKCNGKIAKCTVTVGLAQPKLKKAASAENGKIKVSWSKVSGATGYIVYKKSGKEWKKLATVKSPTVSYTDKGLTSGKKYAYTVAAYKKNDGKTATSEYDKTGVSAKAK